MKKRIILLLCLIMLCGLWGCHKEPDDAHRFKQEYESLNNTPLQGNVLSEMKVNEKNSVRYVDEKDLLNGLCNGTHVVYMGNSQCAWCRRAVPVLIEAVNRYPGISVYYYSIQSAREDYESGKDSGGAGLYKQVVQILLESGYDFSDVVDCYEDGTPKLPASLVLFVKGGEIVGAHRRTVQSHLDPYEPLNEAQKEELDALYDVFLKDMSQYDPVYCAGC